MPVNRTQDQRQKNVVLAPVRPLPCRCTLQDLLGIRFLRGGRSLDGIDCLGLWLAFERNVLGRDVKDPWDEQLQKMHAQGWRQFEEVVPDGWQRIPLSIHELEVGDTVMTLSHRRAKATSHIAPVVACGMVLTIAERGAATHEIGYSQTRRLQDLEAEQVLKSAWRLR